MGQRSLQVKLSSDKAIENNVEPVQAIRHMSTLIFGRLLIKVYDNYQSIVWIHM